MSWRQIFEVSQGYCDNNVSAYYWDSYVDYNGGISIQRYLELNANRLRTRLLSFIHELGTIQVHDKNIVNHLSIKKDLSLWWLSLLVEKSIYKSPCLFDCLRLLALEELLQRDKPEGIELVSSNKKLACGVKALCNDLSILFRWSCVPDKERPRSTSLPRKIHGHLPLIAQSILWLVRHVISQWPLRRLNKQYASNTADVTLFSYFIHLDTKSCSNGIFRSHQWGKVGELLNASCKGANWLQHYLKSPAVPNLRTGISWLAKFNRDKNRQGRHLFVDSFLDCRVVICTLGNILKAGIAAVRLRSLDKKLQDTGMASWLWPLIREDFWESVCGRTAARNLLWVELFDAALAQLPRQRLGFYLWENQGWEQAMIHAWRKHGHGELIAVAHSTIRFWDLRYFNDPRVFEQSVEPTMPLPDKFAVNGPVARDFLINSGYPVSRLLEVEAQRYLGLAAVPSSIRLNKDKSNRRLLILGDIMPASTQRLLRTLADLPADLRNTLEFVFKPHPGNDTTDEYPNVRLTLTRRPLAKILVGFDIVYGANPTSAVVDAYIAGLPVIVQLDTGEINFSPLRGVPGVRFVSEAGELASVLSEIYQKDSPKREQFFWLDTEMTRWRSIITEKTKN